MRPSIACDEQCSTDLHGSANRHLGLPVWCSCLSFRCCFLALPALSGNSWAWLLSPWASVEACRRGGRRGGVLAVAALDWTVLSAAFTNSAWSCPDSRYGRRCIAWTRCASFGALAVRSR
jgi:hypothetical protein